MAEQADGMETALRVPPASCDCHTHVFGPAAQFPYWEGRGYTPPDASVEDLRALHRGLGIERVVIVHPSPYGTDNRVSVDAAQQIGLDCARVIAVIDPDGRDRPGLRALGEQGVVGVRVNLASGGVSDVDKARGILLRTAEQVAPFGWHVQIFTSLQVIEALAQDIADLGVPVVIDHFGLARAEKGAGQPGFAALCDAVESGGVWVKLSAGYRISKAARWEDVDPIAGALLAANAERCVWGTDWPHPGERPPGTPPAAFTPAQVVDDQMALRALWRWCGEDEALFERVLVHNPARLYNFQTAAKSDRA